LAHLFPDQNLIVANPSQKVPLCNPNKFFNFSNFLLALLDRSSIMVSMNRLTTEKRIQVLRTVVGGNSIRATVRITGAAKNKVVKLLRDTGRACEQYHDKVMVDLSCKRIQVDEIWSFFYAK
jgi:hypothetical protein